MITEDNNLTETTESVQNDQWQLVYTHPVKTVPLNEPGTADLSDNPETSQIELETAYNGQLPPAEKGNPESNFNDYKQALEKLLISETRYRRLFETAKDGILILDADSGQIDDVNPFLIEMLGYSHEEFLGKKLWEIGVFKNITASKEAFIELQNKKYIRFEDMPLETKDGKPIYVEFVSNVYLVDDKKVIQCNIRDITDRKLAENALKRSEAHLKELNATKDKFFSIISHDLRGPFSSILGFSNLLLEEVSEKNYKKVGEYSAIIRDSSWRAMDLLTNLLEWSSSQTGRIKFKPQNIDVKDLVNEVVELSNSYTLQKTITISEEIPQNIIVFADKDMISATLRNLISNAIKFTNPGGEVVIMATQKPDELMVAICDNGVGMKKEAIEKLFNSEENHSTLGTRNEMGTGLGLLLCKEFVGRHNGKIWAESEPDKGSTFYFTIPIA